jgi:hypothetical protein
MLGFWFFGCMYATYYGGEKKFDSLIKSLRIWVGYYFFVCYVVVSHITSIEYLISHFNWINWIYMSLIIKVSRARLEIQWQCKGDAKDYFGM